MPSGRVALNWVNRAGGHYSVPRIFPPSCSAATSLPLHLSSSTACSLHRSQFLASRASTRTSRCGSMWCSAMRRHRPENTEKKKQFLSVCVSLLKPLSWTAPSWLIGWSWATHSCPHQQLQGQSLTMCPKAGVWGHHLCHVGIRKVSVDQENRVGSWWAASSASHLCCACSTRSRR